MIIGLSGRMGSGKSTAAEYLATHYGFARVRFAGPLKAMVAGYLATVGASMDRMERLIEGDMKELPCDEFCGRSPRQVMQTLGTDWARDQIAPDFWTRAWRQAAEAELARGAPGVIAEDCRFANECEAVRSFSGKVIRIERPSAEPVAAGHVSEAQVIPHDTLIWNDGPVEILYTRLDGLMDRFRRQAA